MSSSLRSVVDPSFRSTTFSVNKSVEGSHATWITQLRDLYKSSFTAALSQLDTSEKSLKSVRATILDPLMRQVLGIDSSGSIFQSSHSSPPALPITGSVDFLVCVL